MTFLYWWADRICFMCQGNSGEKEGENTLRKARNLCFYRTGISANGMRRIQTGNSWSCHHLIEWALRLSYFSWCLKMILSLALPIVHSLFTKSLPDASLFSGQPALESDQTATFISARIIIEILERDFRRNAFHMAMLSEKCVPVSFLSSIPPIVHLNESFSLYQISRRSFKPRINIVMFIHERLDADWQQNIYSLPKKKITRTDTYPIICGFLSFLDMISQEHLDLIEPDWACKCVRTFVCLKHCRQNKKRLLANRVESKKNY